MPPHIQRECRPPGINLPCVKRKKERERAAKAINNNTPEVPPVGVEETQAIREDDEGVPARMESDNSSDGSSDSDTTEED
jgi:hypothetical protein